MRDSSRRRNGWRRAGRLIGPASNAWPASIGPWLDPGGPERAILDVLERHGHDLGCAVDGDMTEELHAFTGCQVWSLLLAGRLDVAQLRPKRVIEVVGPERAGVQRAGHELPERIEILEHRAVWIIVMRRRVVHVGGQPHRVADGRVLDERQNIGDLE